MLAAPLYESSAICQIHTADDDATKLFGRVASASAVCT